jgi:hypothetical protein
MLFGIAFKGVLSAKKVALKNLYYSELIKKKLIGAGLTAF